ncbi:ATP-grasp domain-containing protein [Streptomyces sp. ISL-99]|uniref:D-alanine--D-alanine ligase family protein n=1 Tax=Streptomyces sp. ISL-99 TaxID=2819193 RepID=UPI002034D9C0|nr:ATP-grasp domain-containing protein [Streptomyces sp. ISL-99]
MHKPTFKSLIAARRIDTPVWTVLQPSLSVAQQCSVIRSSLGNWPVFVKPASGGGSVEASIARDHQELSHLVERAHVEQPYAQYMAEEYIQGMPCTVGVVEIDGRLTTLPVLGVETERPFYDYAAKHDVTLRTEHCPAPLPDWQLDQIRQCALNVHRAVGAHGVSRVDFMVCGDRATVLEINTLPGLSQQGNLATMAKAAGIAYPDLIGHVLRTAFTKPSYVP